MSEQTGPKLVDVREPWEVQTAPFPGALAMPMGDIPSRAFAELDPEEPIIAICHHGVRSLHVVQWLREQGFERAQSLAGSIPGWGGTEDGGCRPSFRPPPRQTWQTRISVGNPATCSMEQNPHPSASHPSTQGPRAGGPGSLEWGTQLLANQG
jgi:rhodanese-related sulfurtransferase